MHITKTLNYNQELNSPKSKSSYRDIDINQATVSMLKQYKHRQVQEAWQLGHSETVVFSDFINEYPNNRTLQTRLRTHFKRADVSNIGFHGFRHTHATLLYESGVDIKDISNRLGHSNIKTTLDVYTHLTEDKKKDVTEKFSKFMSM